MDLDEEHDAGEPPARLFEPRPWAALAACVGKTHVFFSPEHFESEGARVAREERALRYCRRCPVMLTCRDYARRHNEAGIWGGETPADRALATGRVNPGETSGVARLALAQRRATGLPIPPPDRSNTAPSPATATDAAATRAVPPSPPTCAPGG